MIMAVQTAAQLAAVSPAAKHGCALLLALETTGSRQQCGFGFVAPELVL